MKQIYSLITALIVVSFSFASPVITATGNGNWTTQNNWNLTRQPATGDTIVIPANITIYVNQNIQLDNIVIIVYGTMDFNNGKFHFNNASKVVVENGGRITGTNNNEFIKIDDVEKYRGTDADIIGYAYASSTSGNQFIQGGSLPVKFQAFYANRNGQHIQLSWTTSEEINNNHFEIERSIDGRNWNQVALVLGAGTSNVISKYSYTDKNISAAVVYYRIRQVDVNGKFTYSAVKKINSNQVAATANIYASSKQMVTIEFNSEVKDNVQVTMVNMNGQVVARKIYQQAAYRITLDVANASAGVYAVQVSDNSGWKEVKKIMF